MCLLSGILQSLYHVIIKYILVIGIINLQNTLFNPCITTFATSQQSHISILLRWGNGDINNITSFIYYFIEMNKWILYFYKTFLHYLLECIMIINKYSVSKQRSYRCYVSKHYANRRTFAFYKVLKQSMKENIIMRHKLCQCIQCQSPLTWILLCLTPGVVQSLCSAV